MLSSSSLSRFRKNLLAWFSQFQRDLPWRRDKDPYRVWLSEIMLQQTRVAVAIPYYLRFLERFPTVQSLAEAAPQEVLRLWAGLGYYSRARNLQKAAQEIVARHHGIFPQTEEQALALPGIGDYTAAAILSIAYEKNLAVLDGNVARVLARLNAVTGDLRSNGRMYAERGLDSNHSSGWVCDPAIRLYVHLYLEHWILDIYCGSDLSRILRHRNILHRLYRRLPLYAGQRPIGKPY